VTSFDSTPNSTSGAWLALAVVFVMLATTGWTAVRNHRGATTALAASLSAWERGHIGGHRLPDPDDLARPAGPLLRLARRAAAGPARRPLSAGGRQHERGAGTLRYRANHIALGQARKVELKRMHDDRLSPTGQQEAGRRMHRYEDLMSGERHILAFDPMGSGRIAEVFGDLDTAERVSVVVPGVDTNLLTFQRRRTSSTRPPSAWRSPSTRRAAKSASPETRTAVIAWADYTAPSGLGMDAATGIRAEEGAVRLNALVRALPGRSGVALYCHSYGSVVCGVAAHSLPSRVSDIAVAGSPGMRVEKAAQLHTSARVWAVRDADDWIEDVPHLEVGGLGHGADPMSDGLRRAGAVGAGRPGTHRGTSCPAPTACGTSPRSGLARTARCAAPARG
jgi:hypothetical protein